MNSINENNTSEKKPIQVVERLFTVLEILADKGALSLQEVTAASGLNKTTAFRILHSLMSLGYVRQDESGGRYNLTLKLTSLANQIIEKEDIIDLIHPHLIRLMEETHETVHLVRREGAEAVYIDKVESKYSSFRMISRIGARVPLYSTAVGKAIAAEMDPEELEQMWEQSDIRPRTNHTITDLNEYKLRLRDVRSMGYALDDEENEVGVRCVATSILPYRKSEQYAFSISAPVSRIAGMNNHQTENLIQHILQTKIDILKELRG